MEKAKKGDTIKSFDFEKQCGGYFIGVVDRVEYDELAGLDYVYFTSTTRVNRIVTELKNVEAVKKELRVVQNGYPKMFDGELTDFIEIIK